MLPFAASGAVGLALLAYFLALRVSNAPAIATEAGRASSVSLAQIKAYAAQP